MSEYAILLLCAASMLAFANWRGGLFLCVLMAMLQDPLRKLTPGQPVFFIVFVGVVFLAAFAGAFFSRVRLWPQDVLGWRQHMGTAFAWFVALLALQCVNSLLRYGNPIMVAIGLSSYLAPIPAVILGYRFAISRGDVGMKHWLRFYIVVASLALGTVYLEYAGVGSPMFGEVGEGVLISGAGAYYRGNSGIFRAAEIAAWHAAAVACFAFILFWGRRFSLSKMLVALVFIVFLLGVGALTGRRKMIIEVAIFLSTYFCLLSWYRRGNARFAISAAVLGVVAYAFAIGYLTPDMDGAYASERVAQHTGNDFSKYSERASTVFEDLPRRLMDTGVSPIRWAVEGYGWMGGGLGIGSQGAQHFGVPLSGAAEGGLGKLTVELGIPGVAIVCWLLVCCLRYVGSVLSYLSLRSPRHANLAYGLLAFIVANVAAFLIATQAYADIFILLTLGSAAGFFLALPMLTRQTEPAPVVDIPRTEPELAPNRLPDPAVLEYTRRTWDS